MKDWLQLGDDFINLNVVKRIKIDEDTLTFYLGAGLDPIKIKGYDATRVANIMRQRSTEIIRIEKQEVEWTKPKSFEQERREGIA